MDKTLVFYYCFDTVNEVSLIHVGPSLACYITNELRMAIVCIYIIYVGTAQLEDGF